MEFKKKKKKVSFFGGIHQTNDSYISCINCYEWIQIILLQMMKLWSIYNNINNGTEFEDKNEKKTWRTKAIICILIIAKESSHSGIPLIIELFNNLTKHVQSFYVHITAI